MGTMLGNYGMAVNTGTYFGNGYSNVSGRNGSSGYTKVASSSNLNRVSRDIAQGYNQGMEVVDFYIQDGDINQALKLYDKMFEEVKSTANEYGYELDDGQVSSILNKAYENTTGRTFVSTVSEGCKSPLITGLLEGIPIVGWFTNSNSNFEALAKLTGTEVSEKNKTKEAIGVGVSTGLCALVASFCGPVGWIAAAAMTVGAIAKYNRQ